MANNITLLAGEPNDDNRAYLPEAIKQSRMVVNENGNNSQVYPKNLQEFCESITGDGLKDTWFEYVPKSYDPSKKTPLVFSMHGGLMTGWGQCIYTSWTHVADREGFICVFPNAHDKRMWMIECDPATIDELSQPMPEGIPSLNKPTGTVEEYHDVRLVLALLDRMKQRYNIDEGRVFMQGMSMGDCMTSQVARYCGNHFAATAGSGCPTNPLLMFRPDESVINQGGAMDIWQSRLEHDRTPFHYGLDDRTVVRKNLDYWKIINEASVLPKISIRGEKNFAFYQGSKANVVLMDVKNRDHGQTFDDAEMVWDFLFSGVRKLSNGTLEHTTTLLEQAGDALAVAACEGASQAWVNGAVVPMPAPAIRWEKLKYHGLNGDQIVRGSYLCVPIDFLAESFGAAVAQEEDGRRASLAMPDGRIFQFAEGCIGCTVDNRIEAMLCEAIYRNGALYISLEWFCRFALNWQVSEYDGVLYATDHYSVLSRYLSWLLQDLLRGDAE